MSRQLRLAGILAAAALSSSACGEKLPGSVIFGHAVLRGVSDHTGTTVTLSDGDLSADTDQYGYFTLLDVPRGEYFVTASNDHTFERKVSTFVDHDGANPSSVNLVLSPFGRLRGTVTDENGGPVQFATIRVLGTDVSTTSIEEGAFAIDPAPAGDAVIWAIYGDFEPGTSTTSIPVGDFAEVSVALGPDLGPGPYSQNRAPTVSGITLTSRPAMSFPQVIPLVDTTGDVVRRGGSYLLTLNAVDPDGDAVTTFWSADRGTLESTQGAPQADGGFGVVWRAGGGISTLVCTALDPYGGTATARLVVEATGDNLRSGGRFENTVYFSERRTGTFDLHRYSVTAGTEALTAGGGLQQHAAMVIGDWLLYGNSEFVFIGPLVYRITATNLVTGTSFEFGQAFGHDDYFNTRMDLYTPLTSPFIPYQCSGEDTDFDGNGDLCNSVDDTPVGYGYLDLESGAPTPSPDFNYTLAPPASLTSFSRFGDRDVWISYDGQFWRQDGGGEPVAVAAFPDNPVYPFDVQLFENIAATVPAYGGPLYWLDVAAGGPVHEVGYVVTSFALHGHNLAYVEQGPSSASVELLNVVTGETRTLTTEPYFARRIWFMDDTSIIWGDQGTEGQAFVALNTELLWIDEL